MEMWQNILAVALLVGLIYGVYRGVVWAEQDAIRRGKSPLFVKCAVILFFPWGLIAWLVFRPDPVNSNSLCKRAFDLNDFRQQ